MTRPRRVVVRAPAKLNLHLEVLGRRPDGFHEIRTLMQTISLHDRLTLTAHPREIRLTIIPEGLDPGPGNLVVRALEALRRKYRVRSGARVRLWKKIPVGAGLGGGSSDAAAALLAGARLWGLRPDRGSLRRMAAGLGSDVPFFLAGGAAWMGGRGERFLWRGRLDPFHAVVAWPGIQVSTPEAYAALKIPLTPQLRSPSITGEYSGLSTHTQFVQDGQNAFAPWLLRRFKGLRQVAELMKQAGAASVRPTGSGSALFGITSSARSARILTLRLRRAGVAAWSVLPEEGGLGYI